MIKKNICVFLVGMLQVVFTTGLSAHGKGPVVPEVTIPLMKNLPDIDGNIDEKEWAEAMRIEGLMKNTMALESRESILWLGSDGKEIYIAMRSETPEAGSLLSRVQPAGKIDRAVYRDDSIELWLAPGRSKDTDNLKYYQITVNAQGALYDVMIDQGNPQQPTQPGWRVGWKFGSTIKDGWWHAEMAIPFKELEVEPGDTGKPWRMRIGRNWLQPHLQSELAPRIGSFTDLATMTSVNWISEGPLVRMLSLRDEDGTVDIGIEIKNRSKKPYSLRAEIFHRTADNPHHTINELYSLAPGEIRLISVKDGLSLGEAETAINITSPDGNNTYLKRTFQWQVDKPSDRWAAAVENIKAVRFDFGYYPSFNKIKARLDITGLESKNSVEGALLRVRHVNGNVLAERPFPSFSDNRSEMVMDIPALKEGTYEVMTVLQGDNIPSESIVQQFVRQKFEWEGNKLGMIEAVIPPFEPLKVENNKNVKAVLRKHAMNKLGLWEQIVSQDEELLLEPMRFDVVVGGRKYKPEPVKKTEFIKQADNEVIYKAEWKAGPLSAVMQGAYEMDGMLKITMDIKQSGDEVVEQFDLVIPFRKDMATLMHAIGHGLRANYAGYIPEGDGLIWESKQAGTHVVGTFVSYIWLGGEARGIAWFAESDRDWLYDDNLSSQTIHRGQESIELRVHFVTNPAPLRRSRRIVFGLQATPTKPMPGEPAHWRNWVSRPTDEGKDPNQWTHPKDNEQQHWRNWVSRTTRRFSPRVFTHFLLAGSSSWGTDSGHAFIYPVNRDFYIYDLLKETRKTGQRNIDGEREWFTRYDKSLSEGELKSRQNHIIWATRNLAGQPDAVVPYTDPRGSVFNNEFRTFQDEWLVFPYTSRNWDFSNPRGSVAYRVTPIRSFRDYQIWYIKKMLETFADAIYFDNTYLRVNEDIITGAYIADDGSVRPSVDIFNMREHLKRVQILTWQMGRNWLASMSHMTNAQVVPINTWCGTNLEWEWKYGAEDFQDRFSRDMIRTTAIGIHTGSVPFVLGTTGIRGIISDKRREFLMRSLVGTSLVHEIKNLITSGLLSDIYEKLFDFGYGTDECRVYRYWDRDFPVSIDGIDAEGLLLVNNGQALLLLTSFGDTGTGQVKIDTGTLRLKSGGQFVNAETGAVLESTGGYSFSLNLDKHNFVLVHYK